MPNIHRQTRHQTHHTIQYNKRNLILHNRISPPTRHLRNPVDTSYCNRGIRRRNRNEQSLEFRQGAESESGSVPLTAVGTDFEEHVEGETAEDEEGGDLRAESDHHYVVAHGDFGAARGDDGAEGLDYDGGDVGEDEDPGVEAGGEAGELAAVDYDSGERLVCCCLYKLKYLHVFQSQVNSTS
jgi:hypothetical protein